jgi:tetratricopeptide (TPR) repeat protein
MEVENLILEKIQDKVEASFDFFKAKSYANAIKYALSGLQLIKEKEVKNAQLETDLINLIGNSYHELSSASNTSLEIRQEGLSVMRSIAGNNSAVAINIARMMHNIAHEYTKVESQNFDLAIAYIKDAIKDLKIAFPDMDHEYFPIMLTFLKNICITLDEVMVTKYNEANYKSMQVIAKANYNSIKEFMSDEPELAQYAASLGTAYNKLGKHEEALLYLNEAKELMEISNFANKDIDVANIQALIDESLDAIDTILHQVKEANEIAFENLASSDYKAAADFAIIAVNLLINNSLSGNPLALDTKKLIGTIGYSAEQAIAQNYKDKQYEEGIKLSLDMVEKLSSFSDLYNGTFNAGVGEGYYKDGNCSAAMEYLPIGLEIYKKLSNPSVSTIELFIDICMNDAQADEIIFPSSCEGKGFVQIEECANYLTGELEFLHSNN